MIIGLLAVVSSSALPIREAGLKYAIEFVTFAEKHNSTFLPLLKKLVRCEGEVLSCWTFIQQVTLCVFITPGKQSFRLGVYCYHRVCPFVHS